MVDVSTGAVVPAVEYDFGPGIAIRKRCVSRLAEHQAILLQRLGLELPACIECADL
jgi:hypothetical protein